MKNQIKIFILSFIVLGLISTIFAFKQEPPKTMAVKCYTSDGAIKAIQQYTESGWEYKSAITPSVAIYPPSLYKMEYSTQINAYPEKIVRGEIILIFKK